MSIVQKLKIDGSLTDNNQIVVRDETGLYNPSNLTGYGGNNGNPPSKFSKYIFELLNLYTGNIIRQIQSDDLTNTTEFHNPSLSRIVNKENITISAVNYQLANFEDGLYKLFMNVVISDEYTCNSNINTDIISNVANIQFIYDTFSAIIGNGIIYKIQGIAGNNLIVDKPIINSFTKLNPIITNVPEIIILSDVLDDYINSFVARLSKHKDHTNSSKIEAISEIQLYYWQMKRCIDKGDVFQAYDYFKIAKDLAASINFDCDG